MFTQMQSRKMNHWNARPSNRMIRRIPNQEFNFVGDAATRVAEYQLADQREGRYTPRSLRSAANQQSGPIQVEQKTAPQVAIVSPNGIRNRSGWILLIGAAAIMILVLLFKVGSIGMIEADTQAKEDAKHALKQENAELTSTLVLWEKSAHVRYEAVKLGMVDADGVKRVVIPLP